MRYLSDPMPEFNPPIGDMPADLWGLRRWGVKVRNAVPTTLDQMTEWEAAYMAWRAKTLAAADQESQGLAAWMETLNEITHAPLNDFWDPKHELLARCLSEELRRLEKYLCARTERRDPRYHSMAPESRSGLAGGIGGTDGR